MKKFQFRFSLILIFLLILILVISSSAAVWNIYIFISRDAIGLVDYLTLFLVVPFSICTFIAGLTILFSSYYTADDKILKIRLGFVTKKILLENISSLIKPEKSNRLFLTLKNGRLLAVLIHTSRFDDFYTFLTTKIDDLTIEFTDG